MEDILFSANIVLPLLMLMAVGYVSRRLKLLDASTVSQCNSVLFKVFLAVLLFNNTRATDFENLADIKILVFVAVLIVFSFLSTALFVVGVERDNRRRGVMIQGICRSNYALYGIPLITALFPGGNVALASLLIAVVIPLFNVFSVIALSYCGTKNVKIGRVLLSILTNPLIIGTVLGMVFSYYSITIPSFLDSALISLGSIATPFALFILGASFEFRKITGFLPQLITITLGKLIVIPAIAITLAVLLGFEGVEIACIMAVFGSPVAVSSYTMAEKMGGDADLAASTVVFTSVLSIFTMFLIIWVLRLLEIL